MEFAPNDWLAARRKAERPVEDGLRLSQPWHVSAEESFSVEALHLLSKLERRLRERRRMLIAGRAKGRFSSDPIGISNESWRVGAPPAEFQNPPLYQEVPATREGLSRLQPFVAPWIDLRDTIAPTWDRVQLAQVAIDEHFAKHFVPFNSVLRPRAWTDTESAICVDGEPVCAAFFDVALFLFRHAKRLADLGGITLSLGDLGNRFEAKLWSEFLDVVEQELGLESGTVRVAIEVDSLHALRHLDSILGELRTRATAVVADRCRFLASLVEHWDHLRQPAAPERFSIGSNRRALRAYAQLVVRIAHHRGALAIAAPIEDRVARFAEQSGEFELDLADGFDSLRARSGNGLDEARRTLSAPRPILTRSVISWADLDYAPRGGLTTVGVERTLQTALRQAAAWLHGSGELRLGERHEHGASLILGAHQLAHWADRGARTLEGERVSLARLEASTRGLLARIRARIGVEAFAHSNFERAAWVLLRWLDDPSRGPFGEVLRQSLPGNALDPNAARAAGGA